MKLGRCTLLGGALLLACSFPLFAGAQKQVSIAPSGTTVVRKTFPKGRVAVSIHTVKLEGRCAEACPVSHGWASRGFRQRVIIEDMAISVNGHDVPVPLSAYATFLSPHFASLRLDRGSFVLRIEGADGAYTYINLLYFDATGVNEKKVYSGMYPIHPIEVTHYYSISLGH